MPESKLSSACRDGFESEAPEWYADGLRFECTQCGNCCTGPEGVVWFTPDEGRAMAKARGVSEQEFNERYARKVGRRWSLSEKQTRHGNDCIFLDRETLPGKAICSVYKSRPAQCRTWPFWPENLHSRRTWEAVKRRTPCPGMDRGKLVPLVQIRIQRNASQK